MVSAGCIYCHLLPSRLSLPWDTCHDLSGWCLLVDHGLVDHGFGDLNMALSNLFATLPSLSTTRGYST